MWIPNYADGRPTTALRMNAQDHGVVLKHGDGPNRCDFYGARSVNLRAEPPAPMA